MWREGDASRVQGDASWSFCYAKAKNAPKARAAQDGAGDVWTWTALDSDSKMILPYEVGDRSGATAIEFMDDLRARLATRVQLTTDGPTAYLRSVEDAFGAASDYAQHVKTYRDDQHRSHEEQ